MSTVGTDIEPLVHHCLRENPKHRLRSKLWSPYSFNYSPKKLASYGRSFYCETKYPGALVIRAISNSAAMVDNFESTDLLFKETFPLEQKLMVNGKVFIRLDHGKDERNCQLTVGCNLPGKWILHWGVSYINDVGTEWDQPPRGMRPPGSVRIKDYAIETPLKRSSSSGGDLFQEVKISLDLKSAIAAIHFILKDEETGACYQHRGSDFKVPLVKCLQADGNIVREKRSFGLWPVLGSLGQLYSIFVKSDDLNSKYQDKTKFKDNKQEKITLEGFYEELPISKEDIIKNSVIVSVKKSPETAECLLYIETDLPAGVVVHWGVCRDGTKRWEIPSAPYPPNTVVFKDKALRTALQPKEDGNGCWGLFSLEEGLKSFLFVLKLNESTWLKCMGNDFCIPLSSSSISNSSLRLDQSEGSPANEDISLISHTNRIINEIRNFVTDISSKKNRKTKSNEAQENVLQEIEKLAAEAYIIFRNSIPTFSQEAVSVSKEPKRPAKVSSGTGSGFEILCQGFNWESHKSGRWYMELNERAEELSSLGFTVIWLPPPTESVSPEGYMPKDLYNLNSRYGNVEELKDIVKKFHDVGIKVLGDVVLNHRCAHYQNQNGVWNIFGGRLNWDDRAVVADDPHFQGRGNKSSGDSFHAAPNIDHSQDFVRRDIKEWLYWLRKEIGYDGWRLDFVRGFWGGYVKDYIDASEPYFAVGEYWDSLSYTYGEMDHNQDAHRQRIIDWINATNGAAGAFDVTTKGILHSVLERCEYWRLSDQKGKPPGVVGWWPSRAVTFIENHDTGSTQGHWRFPGGKEMQGYTYILTHPGTPTVFYDHIFSHYRSELAALISLRSRKKLHCRSRVEITKAERDLYAAIIDEKVAMKIGPGSYEPPSGPQKWSVATEGRDYKVWEAS